MRLFRSLSLLLTVICFVHLVLAVRTSSTDPSDEPEPLFTILPFPPFPGSTTTSSGDTTVQSQSLLPSDQRSSALSSSDLLTNLPIGTLTQTPSSSAGGSSSQTSALSSISPSSIAPVSSSTSTQSITVVSGSETLRSLWAQGMGIGIATVLLILFLAGL
jgi:hypothetical protein